MLFLPWFYLDMVNNSWRPSASHLKWFIWKCTKLSGLDIKFNNIVKNACANIYSSSYAFVKYPTHLSVDIFWYGPFPLIQRVSSLPHLLRHRYFYSTHKLIFFIPSNSFMPIHRKKCARKILIPSNEDFEGYVFFFLSFLVVM